MLVLRPADVVETTVAWKLAMENVYTPTALILSRQNITDLPAKENRYQEALQAEKGAYIVNEDANADVILWLPVPRYRLWSRAPPCFVPMA